MNAITETRTRALAIPDGADPYGAYGQAATATAKTFIIFDKGEYQAGQGKDEVPLGTRFIAGVHLLRLGWKKWAGKTVVDDRMDFLVHPETGQVFQPSPRSALGDLDPKEWEKNDRNEPRDPWQLHNELPLRSPESGDEFVYATSAKGGIGAIGELCKAYGKGWRQKPGLAPVIELGRDSYVHKQYGKVYFPVFTIVDWVPETGGVPDQETPPEPIKAKEPEKPKHTRF